MTRIFRGEQKRWLTSLLGLPVILGVLLFYAAGLSAQDSPKFIINEDCQVFDIASNNSIVYAVPHLKRIRRLVLERDDISVATPAGKTRQIVDADKFLPPTPPGGFVVNSLSWSPDGRRIAVSMTLQQAPAGFTMDKKEAKKQGNMDDNEENAPILPREAAGPSRCSKTMAAKSRLPTRRRSSLRAAWTPRGWPTARPRFI